MCFSAGASFAAGAGLAIIGGASLKVGRGEEKIIAFIPIAFAIQQVLEGIQWLALGRGCTSFFSGYGFLFFALIFWPIYVPFAVYILDKKKRKILRWFVVLGACLASFFVFLLLTEPLAIFSVNQSISYNFKIPFDYLATLLYMSVIILPLLLSSHHMFRLLALAVAFLGLFATFFFFETFISVWCFFSAIISMLCYFYLKRKTPHMLK